MEEIQQRIEKDERILVTTLTKRMAEELTDYFMRHDIRTNYIHSDVDSLNACKLWTIYVPDASMCWSA